MSALDSLLKELEDKANDATKGPWDWLFNGDTTYVGPTDNQRLITFDQMNMEGDAHFVAIANPDTVKKLIEVIRRMMRQLDWEREEVLEDCEKIVSGE